MKARRPNPLEALDLNPRGHRCRRTSHASVAEWCPPAMRERQRRAAAEAAAAVGGATRAEMAAFLQARGRIARATEPKVLLEAAAFCELLDLWMPEQEVRP